MGATNIEGLKMQELRIIAKKHKINSFGMTKAKLIREIQVAEGNFDCFGSAVQYCDQWGCRYRPLCFDEAKKWTPDQKTHRNPTTKKGRKKK
jgi:hypothetical protein